MQRNHKDTKTQSDGKIEYGLSESDGSYPVLLQVMVGLEDVKQGRFSDKSILDIGVENG